MSNKIIYHDVKNTRPAEQLDRNKSIYDSYLAIQNYHKVSRAFGLTPQRIHKIIKQYEKKYVRGGDSK